MKKRAAVTFSFLFQSCDEGEEEEEEEGKEKTFEVLLSFPNIPASFFLFK